MTACGLIVKLHKSKNCHHVSVHMRSNLQKVWLLQAGHSRISRRAADSKNLDDFRRPGLEPNSPSDAAQLPGKRGRGRPRVHSVPSQPSHPSSSAGFGVAQPPETYIQQHTPQMLPVTHAMPRRSQCIFPLNASAQPSFDRHLSSAERQTSPLDRASALSDGYSPPSPSASEAQDLNHVSHLPVDREQRSTAAADADQDQPNNLHPMPRRSQCFAAAADSHKPDSIRGIHLDPPQQAQLRSVAPNAKLAEAGRAAIESKDDQLNVVAGSRNTDSDANRPCRGRITDPLVGTALGTVKGVPSCKPSSIPTLKSIAKCEFRETPTHAAPLPSSPSQANLKIPVSSDSCTTQSQSTTEADPLGAVDAQPAATAAAAADCVLEALAKSYWDAQAYLTAHPGSSPPTASTCPGTPAAFCTVAKTEASNTAPYRSSQPAATREHSPNAADSGHQLPDQLPGQLHIAAQGPTSPATASLGQATTRSGKARKQTSGAGPEALCVPADSQLSPDAVRQAQGLGPRRSTRSGLAKSAGTGTTPTESAAIGPTPTEPAAQGASPPVASNASAAVPDAAETKDTVAAETVKRAAASPRWSEQAKKPKVSRACNCKHHQKPVFISHTTQRNDCCKKITSAAGCTPCTEAASASDKCATSLKTLLVTLPLCNSIMDSNHTTFVCKSPFLHS